jgi:hypothetical protein
VRAVRQHLPVVPHLFQQLQVHLAAALVAILTRTVAQAVQAVVVVAQELVALVRQVKVTTVALV